MEGVGVGDSHTSMEVFLWHSAAICGSRGWTPATGIGAVWRLAEQRTAEVVGLGLQLEAATPSGQSAWGVSPDAPLKMVVWRTVGGITALVSSASEMTRVLRVAEGTHAGRCQSAWLVGWPS